MKTKTPTVQITPQIAPTEVLSHVWQDAGLGTAPFQFVALISLPAPYLAERNPMAYQNAMREVSQQARAFGVRLGGCDACGQALQNNCVIRDADGKHFVVGCDCVRKTGDTKVMTATEAANRDRQRELRRAASERRREARQREWEAQKDAERAKNGGKTDAEIAWEKREKEEAVRRAAVAEANRQETAFLIPCLEDQAQTEFIRSVLADIKAGKNSLCGMSPRLKSILADIYAKHETRDLPRGKKADARLAADTVFWAKNRASQKEAA